MKWLQCRVMCTQRLVTIWFGSCKGDKFVLCFVIAIHTVAYSYIYIKTWPQRYMANNFESSPFKKMCPSTNDTIQAHMCFLVSLVSVGNFWLSFWGYFHQENLILNSCISVKVIHIWGRKFWSLSTSLSKVVSNKYMQKPF